MTDTIFSKIIAGDVSAEIVYKDDQVLAFLDNQPINPGHTLIVPRKAFVNLFDANPDVLAHMTRVAQRIAHALQTSVNAEGVNMYMNSGAEAGQEVFHAHLHVVPRYAGDNRFEPPHRPEEPAYNATAVGERLREALLRRN